MSQGTIVEICRAMAQSGLVLLLQSSFVLLLGLCLGAALRRRGPLAQSTAYRATLCAVVCTVLFSIFFAPRPHPLVRVSLPQAPPQATFAPVVTPPAPVSAADGTPAGKSPKITPTLIAPAANPPRVAPVAEIVTPAPLLAWTSRLYLAAIVLWAAGVVWLLAGIVFGQWVLWRLHRRSVAVNYASALELRASAEVRSPFLAGFWRPVVYLPNTYATDFDAAELQAIVAHEAAHQERRDVAWTLAARLTCALLWPQPLLWLLVRRMELAAEEVCDVLALTQGCPARAYADCLLSLAERLTPSRAERRLGLGVVPFQSQVGQRIQQILSGSPRPPRVSRLLRAVIVVTTLVAVVAGLLVIAVSRPSNTNRALADTAEQPHPWAAPDGYLAQFPSALPGGGTVQPIQILSVFNKAVLYPALLTENDKTLLQQCKADAVVSTMYGSGGPSVHDRRVLEEVLARRPHFFYAEYLLGVWYKKSHDPTDGLIWISRALQDAPAILAGRVQFGDGKPVNGFTFSPNVSLYRSANFMDGPYDYNDTRTLIYPDVTADANGCYYLPVFRAVYEMPSWSSSLQQQPTHTAQHAAQINLMSPQTGSGGLSRFTVTGRVGVLPPFIARPYLTIGAPFAASNGDEHHPLRVADAAMTVTWPRYPGAAQYEASLSEVILGPHGNRSESSLNFDSADPHFHNGLPTTSMTLPLSGNTPVLFRNRLYALTITARDAAGNQLVNSQPYYFQPLAGVAPVPLTKAGLTKILPPGFTVSSITPTAGGGVITGTRPEASNLDSLLERQPFAWKSQSSDEWPLYAGGVYTQRTNFRITYSTTGKVAAGSAATPIVTSTATGGAIVGRIVYADGKPAAGVPVIAHMEEQSMEVYEAAFEASHNRSEVDKEDVQTVSGPDGFFQLRGLEKGHYDVIETAKPGRWDADPKWVAAARTGIAIKPGVVSGVPDLILTHGAVLTGTVYDKKTGQPIPGGSTGPFINVLGPRYPASMGGSSSATVDGHGHYALRLAPGTNWLSLSGGWDSSNIDIDPMNNSNPKYPNYARGVYLTLREGETKTVPINAVRAKTP